MPSGFLRQIAKDNNSRMDFNISVKGFLLVSYYYSLSLNLLFYTKYQPYCDTKYIFKIGKNKFDKLCHFRNAGWREVAFYEFNTNNLHNI